MPKPQSTALVIGGRRKVHTTFPDGKEMVEEFDVQTNQILLRKSRAPTTIGREQDWVYEIGEQPQTFNPSNDLMAPSTQNPSLVRLDGVDSFLWRIRNLPYPKETYNVTVDEERNQIVVRTSNKKYFKRIEVPDMDHLELRLDDAFLHWDWSSNTLKITYPKPDKVLAAERARSQSGQGTGKGGAVQDGDVECNQQ